MVMMSQSEEPGRFFYYGIRFGRNSDRLRWEA